MKRLLLGMMLCLWPMEALAQTDAPSAEPKPGLTRGEAESAFALAVLSSCLTALESHTPIAGLDPGLRKDLRPVTDAERKRAPFKDKTVPMWSSLTLGSHLTVSETSATQCDVIADQLPVEETYREVLTVVKQANPGWYDVPQKPGYNPIVYQVEGDYQGAHYAVHLDGAEPGALFHAYRHSLLTARVTRTP